ncbi:MAG: hypothetical protein B7Z80_08275 [Rhodospirillales bacterium 20-64-7]|nr:MAG: hypothetical protein B7Z80_08275 [Rhodospirillales bacterium 20-64-7]
MEHHALHLAQPGWSNPSLPVLVYRGAAGANDPAAFEALFGRHGWPAAWRNGVYRFHHFHSNAHEALGFAAGSARLRLGGPAGEEVAVAAGDAVLLPAGTGHFLIEASSDFLVVGAYPPDQRNPDLCRIAADAAQAARIAGLEFPQSDPVQGAKGLIQEKWSAA